MSPNSLLAVLVLGGALTGCTADKALQAANTGATSAAPAPSAAPKPAETVAPPPLPHADFVENDFVESDRNRDPFRSYVAAFAAPARQRAAKNQRAVVLGQFSIDELKLVAIVGAGDFPRAMVLDPGGKGWVLKRGDFVGRPEVVHIGGANGVDYQINWRVDRIRDGDVVFLREDPAQPAIPPATRVDAPSRAARLARQGGLTTSRPVAWSRDGET